MHGVNKLLYSDLKNGTQYFNLARDLAWSNQKNEEITTRDGHVFGYLVNVKIHGAAINSISFATAGNNWQFRNAFRKWHAYRQEMFANAGVSPSEQGRYGKTIRPYLDPNMKTGDIRSPVFYDDDPTSADYNSGDWTYTQIASSPGFAETPAVGSEGQAMVDTYELTILGENDVTATTTLGTEYYTSVGMIHSYNQDRQEVITPTADGETVEGHNNPLALLRNNSTTGGELMTIVEGQELESPPYDIRDASVPSIAGTIGEIMQINPGYDGTNSVPVLRTGSMFVPAGLMTMYTTTADEDASVLIEVVAKVLCKDMA